MGQCSSEPQNNDKEEVVEGQQPPSKATPVNAEAQQDQVQAQAPLEEPPVVDQQKIEEEKAVAIQSAFRQVKAKKELQAQKELAEQDKPQDGIPYQGEFQIPELPQLFKDKVDKSVTNQNRMLPAYKLDDGSVYQGQWNKGKKQGYGMMKKIDGTFLEGQWTNDTLSNGAVLYPNGDIFAGTDHEGMINFASTGVVYEGEVHKRLPNGKGEEVHQDKTKYVGSFKNGVKDGVGKLIFADGSYYEGQFFRGDIQGQGVFHWKDGSSYSGDWLKSTKHGKGTFTWPDQKKYTGEFKNDLKEGHGKITYTDGSAYEGEFQNDKRHGKGKIIKVDKSVVECEWKNGELVE